MHHCCTPVLFHFVSTSPFISQSLLSAERADYRLIPQFDFSIELVQILYADAYHHQFQ